MPFLCSGAVKETEDEHVVTFGEYFDENVLEIVYFTLRKYCSLILRNSAVSNVVHKAEKVQLSFSIREYFLSKVCKKSVQGVSIFILQNDDIRLAPSEFLDALLDIRKSLLCLAPDVLIPRPSLAALLRIVAVSQQEPLEHAGSL